MCAGIKFSVCHGEHILPFKLSRLSSLRRCDRFRQRKDKICSHFVWMCVVSCRWRMDNGNCHSAVDPNLIRQWHKNAMSKVEIVFKIRKILYFAQYFTLVFLFGSLFQGIGFSQISLIELLRISHNLSSQNQFRPIHISRHESRERESENKMVDFQPFFFFLSSNWVNVCAWRMHTISLVP